MPLSESHQLRWWMLTDTVAFRQLSAVLSFPKPMLQQSENHVNGNSDHNTAHEHETDDRAKNGETDERISKTAPTPDDDREKKNKNLDHRDKP
jgi:hypothetical protein